MGLLKVGEPFGRSALHLGAGGGDRVAEVGDLQLQRLDQVAGVHLGRERGESEHRRFAARALAGAPGAQDHQVRQLGHHLGILLDRAQEGLARQGHQLAVAQGHHRGGVRRAGDHRHLAGRLAGADHAHEARLLAFRPLDHAQPPRHQEIEPVGVLAGVEQHPPARQGEPRRLGRAPVAHEQPRQRRILEIVGQIDHGGSLTSAGSRRQRLDRVGFRLEAAASSIPGHA